MTRSCRTKQCYRWRFQGTQTLVLCFDIKFSTFSILCGRPKPQLIGDLDHLTVLKVLHHFLFAWKNFLCYSCACGICAGVHHICLCYFETSTPNPPQFFHTVSQQAQLLCSLGPKQQTEALIPRHPMPQEAPCAPGSALHWPHNPRQWFLPAALGSLPHLKQIASAFCVCFLLRWGLVLVWRKPQDALVWLTLQEPPWGRSDRQRAHEPPVLVPWVSSPPMWYSSLLAYPPALLLHTLGWYPTLPDPSKEQICGINTM